MNHWHSCVPDGNTHHEQSPISTRISAIVSSVVALVCACALMFSPNAAIAVDSTATNPPTDTTTNTTPANPGNSGTSPTPANPSTPSDSSNTEPAKPATPAQPAPTQQNTPGKTGTTLQQTSPSTRSSNPSTSSSSSSSNSSSSSSSSSSRKSTQSNNSSNNNDNSNSQSDTTSATAAKNSKKARDDAEVTIIASTPVVTATSGYHLKATIKNTSNDTIVQGTFTVSANDYYTFASRSELQQWAQGNSRIQVPNQLGQVPVPQIEKDEKVSVSIDMNSDQPSLKNMLSWGPKPVRIDYSFPENTTSDDGTKSNSQTTYVNTTHTFLTRSSDGLNTANTPPMDITMVMPLTGDNWQVDNDKLNKFLTTGDSDVAKTPTTTSGTAQNGNDNSAGNDAIVNSMLTNATGGNDKKNSGTHKLSQTAEQLVTKHPGLQVIADPTLAQNLAIPPKSAGIMQPGNFDITTYSALNDESSYEKAGAATKTWTADASIKQYRKALGDPNANPTAYAWPGRGQWTMDSLQTAKQQGYSTVIAPEPSSTADSTNSTIHTGKYTIRTSAGDVTVFTAQDELSRLAEGKATDKSVDGESSAAGRLARFMAQSAFYQMESPYATRNLLVCFGTSAVNSENNAQEADTLMQTLEQAPWLSLRNLSELDQAKTYLSGQRAANMVPDSSDIHASSLRLIKQTLSSLVASKNDVDRFNSSILDQSSEDSSTEAGTSGKSNKSDKSGDSNKFGGAGDFGGGGASGDFNNTDKPGTSTDANGTNGASTPQNQKSNQSGNTSNPGKSSPSSSSNTNNGSGGANGNSNNPKGSKTDTGDAQALARQDADATAKRSKDGCDWIDAITSLHNAIALHALSASDALAKNMSASAQNLANQLMNGVAITPSESITVLSESAKMPVTVSNNHPYPVTVKISSLSNSMEIVTTRFVTLSIPARSEAQTTFNVRVSTSGTAIAHLTLTDRKGDAFSTPQSTRITSTLRLSDMSGIIFIAIALVLGVIGLWRQFNRKKDPDE
nr:DUF6049 family protein [Bifidobacterium sp. ESL0745]